MNRRFILWCIILLSASLYNAAFFFPDSMGFLVLPAVILLGVFFIQNTSNFLQAGGYGLGWGLTLYGPHFWWLYQLLRTKSQAGPLLSVMLYSALVSYFAATSLAWFGLAHMLMNRLKSCWLRAGGAALVLVSYFLFMDYVSLIIFGQIEGYPFLHPLIPLARYKPVLWGLFLLTSLWYQRPLDYAGHNYDPAASYQLVYIKPCVHKDCISRMTQELYHQLACHEQAVQAPHLIFVSPESCLPFPLNTMTREVVQFWHCAMPRQSHFLLGSHYESEQGDLGQAVYWTHAGRIISNYVKKHSVPFVEKMPPFFKNYTILKNIFLKGLHEMGGKEHVDNQILVFTLSPKLGIIPRMCSELFFKSRVQEFLPYVTADNGMSYKLFFFVNDSWFVDYFKKIMENLTYLKSAQIGLPIVYIGHDTSKELSL